MHRNQHHRILRVFVSAILLFAISAPTAALSGQTQQRRIVTRAPQSEQDLIVVGPRYLRVFFFGEYYDWPGTTGAAGPMTAAGNLVSRSVIQLAVTNPVLDKVAKVRAQTFTASGRLVDEADFNVRPGRSVKALEFKLGEDTPHKPALIVLTSNVPIIAFGFASREQNIDKEEARRAIAARSFGTTELTPREFDCQAQIAELSWLCSRPTSKTRWGDKAN